MGNQECYWKGVIMAAKDKYYTKDVNGQQIALGDLVASSFSYGDKRIPVQGIVWRVTNSGLMGIEVEANPGNPGVHSTKKFHPEHTTLLARETEIDKYRASLVDCNQTTTTMKGK